VLLLTGVWSSITLWQKIHTESYINGSIDLTNEMFFESFTYDNSLFDDAVVFAHDIYDTTNTYLWQSENLPTVADFNGIDKIYLSSSSPDNSQARYQIEINNYRILDATINAGGVIARINIDFYDTENNLLCAGYYDIFVRFLSNRTELEIKTTGQQNANFIEQYFTDNGLRIKIKEILQ
jgi:hypothetical protein